MFVALHRQDRYEMLLLEPGREREASVAVDAAAPAAGPALPPRQAVPPAAGRARHLTDNCPAATVYTPAPQQRGGKLYLHNKPGHSNIKLYIMHSPQRNLL